MFAHHRMRLLIITLLLGLAAALPGLVAAAPAHSYNATTVIPYSSGGYKYQVVAQDAGTGFQAPAYNDSAFATGGVAPFGTPGGCIPPAPIATSWTVGSDILLRKSFTLPAGATNLKVGIAIDNDVQVFLNGIDISSGLQQHEYCATRDSFVFTAADSLLVAGTNVLAVRGRDRGGESYLDVQVTVDELVPFTVSGFFQPVDMDGVLNTVKGGSSVPLKFTVAQASVAQTSTDVVASFTQRAVSCDGLGSTTDDIEVVTTGGTSLRYDATAGQFIQNWQTPKQPGACYVVTVTLIDGTPISATFKLK